ncbi:MAG: hypothetical protein ABFR63_08050, partial [Thermodesulfobacteriota bacterium]
KPQGYSLWHTVFLLGICWGLACKIVISPDSFVTAGKRRLRKEKSSHMTNMLRFLFLPFLELERTV